MARLAALISAAVLLFAAHGVSAAQPAGKLAETSMGPLLEGSITFHTYSPCWC